ncbi:serine/threonine-protein kinase [Streptomyces sp. NPDC017940]|uniref:serine/threonine-protein kinase n=1 Tax=Streptomyces sp. NPDC017940 TaxID=3365017 RepID=UPI0037890F94
MSEAEQAGKARQDQSARLLAGRYRLGDVLGRGGMGTVWRAKDETLGRTVAVKELRFPSSIDEDEKRRLITRTLREAKAIARIRNTSAVTVYDVVDEDDRPWIVMELVEGKSLAEAVREDGLLTPRRAAEVGLAVLDVLRSAHREGILHRDVKPSNVLIAEDGRVVLTDFGIAQVEGDPSITSTGMLVGAPSYISPERARGHKPGPAADMWSLGGLIYAAVEGAPPYDKGSAIATLTAVMTEAVEPPRNAGPLLEKVIYGLLAKDPEQRLDDASARAMLQEVINAPDLPEPKAQDEPMDATKIVPLPPIPPQVPRDRASGSSGSVGSSSSSGSVSSSGSIGSAGSSGAAGSSGSRKGEEAAERLKGAFRSVRKKAATARGAGAGAGAAGAGAAASSGTVGVGDRGAGAGEAGAGRAGTGVSTGAGAAVGVGSGPAPGKGTGEGTASGKGTGKGAGAAGAGAGAGVSSAGAGVAMGSAGAGPGAHGGARVPAQPAGPPRPPARAPLTDVVPRRTLVIIAVVVALAVIGTVLAFALSGGDDSPNSGKGDKSGDSSSSSGATAGGDGDGKGSGKDEDSGSGADKGKGDQGGQGKEKDGSDPDSGKDDSGQGSAIGGGGKGSDDGAETTYKHAQGFSLGLPKGWKFRSTDRAGARFTGPDDQKLLIGWTTTPKDNPVADWKSQESAMRRAQYDRIRIEKVGFRGWNTADWEFTYVEGGTKYRSVDRGFVVNGGLGYGMMYTAKADDWGSDQRRDTWQTFTRTFEPKK